MRCDLIDGSITDPSDLENAMRGVDYVFHLASLVSVDESILKPLEAVDINVRGLINVLEAARKEKVKKVVFASSASVYGRIEKNPKCESMTPDPRSAYAIIKLNGEHFCDIYTDIHKLECVALRFFNVFGPRQNCHSQYSAAVPIFFDQAIKNAPITIHGDGLQTRDFIFVKDIVCALAFAAEESSVNGVHNIRYGKSTTILGLANEIIRITGSTSCVEHHPKRIGDIRHSTADPSSFRKAGWREQHNLSEGLQITFQSMINSSTSNS